MKLQMMHAGISHPSPYFYNLSRAINRTAPEIELRLAPDIPDSTTNEGILHFHRLKRYYDSNSLESAEAFARKLEDAKRKGWKTVWTVHNFFPIDREISPVDMMIAKRIAEMSEVIFTHTELMKESAERLFSREVTNCSFGINQLDNAFDTNRIALTREDYETVFAFGGNIAPYKCVPECIANFKRLRAETKKRVRLIIAGPSSGISDLEKHIADDPDINRFDFFIGKSSWRELVRTADVFLAPYDTNFPAFRYGFFASTVPQLLSYRAPLITPDCPEVREFIKAGESFCYFGEEGLYEAMKSATNPEARKKIQDILKSYESPYSWTKTVKTLVEAYKKISKR